MGMEAIAITDHGSMFGCLEFFNEAKKQGVKPIIGCEVYVAEKSRFEKTGKDDRSGYHLILLAKNKVGYHNLVRLCSIGWREGFYYTPRIDKEVLEKYSEGLIVCSACLGGEIPQLLMSGGVDKAAEAVEWFKNIFGDDFYLEMQNHGLEDQQNVNKGLIELSQRYGIKLIATNDIHFVNADDKEAHKILVYLNTGKKMSDEHQMMYTGEEYLKSPQEMAALFPDYPDAITNTLEIAEKVEEFKLQRDILLPKFPIPENFENEMQYLRHLTIERSKERWGDPIPENILERLNFELDTVERMGFPGYFLIVQDFIAEARKMGVLVGPGRGSAAGSAIAYAIGITNVDPIKYDLLFERFLNPERISMPDVDIDFDDAGRERVIQYVVNKYGDGRVAQIITFGTMAAKSSIKDVARVLDLPLIESDRLSKLVPTVPGMTLDKAFKEEPALEKERTEGLPLIQKTLKFAKQLEGSTRSTGTHACGMIIAPDDLMEYVPLSNAKDSTLPVTQYEGTLIESVGLLKMDFLGLKTLSIIKEALNNIKLRHNIDIDIDAIPLDDEKTFELFGRGDTTGIFQFESDGMKKYLIDLKPNRLEDLIAMNALYRPGPMEYIPQFINRKFGREEITYDLADMEEYLKETYGICVYQEQVMLLSQKLANFSKGDADTLRKAMGKKQIETLNKMKSKFMDGCTANNHDLKICEKIWTDWEAFASYAFNKSHSTCYAFIAYQTGYLKAHYPAEFMAAVLTNNLSDIKQITFFMEECKRLKIDLLGPNVNESQLNFTVNKAGAIRFGLAAVKGVGEQAVEALIAERNENGAYQSIFDFVKRINLRMLNKRCMESLVKAGAFDDFKLHRAQYLYQKPGDTATFLDNLMNFASKYQQNVQSAQASLFGDSHEEMTADPEVYYCEPFPKIEELKYEKEVTGFFISGHPLDDYKFEINQFKTATINEFKDDLQAVRNKELKFGGIITNAQHLTSKTGNPFGRFTIEDFDDSIEITLFGQDYVKFKNFMISGLFVFVQAGVKNRWGKEDMFELKISEIQLLEDLMKTQTRKIVLKLDLPLVNDVFIQKISKLVKEQKGSCNLIFEISDTVNKIGLTMPARKYSVDPSAFIRNVREELPELQIKLG